MTTSYQKNAEIIISALNKTGLFEKINHQELATIEDWVDVINVYEGKIIVEEGESDDCIFVVMTGELDVFTVNGNNNICVLAHLEAGDYFGEQAKLNVDKGKRNASVIAVAPSKLIKIPKVLFRKILRRDSELYIALNKKKVIQKIENEFTLNASVNA